MKEIQLIILAAVDGEIAPLLDALPSADIVDIAGRTFASLQGGGFTLLAGTTGIGKVNAAAVTSALLTRFGPVEVWNIGCAGAYSGGGLRIGDVLITEECLRGDEGVLLHGSPARVESMGDDTFPLRDMGRRRILRGQLRPGGYTIASPSGLARQFFPDTQADGSFSLKYGKSLTVSMASGDLETAAERFRCTAAHSENMEGSAVAQTCRLFGAPFLECRGISNIAGVRDKTKWDFRGAMANCHSVIRTMLATFR